MSLQFTQHRQTGFSLVEILVGMAVGLLGILVIFQMYSMFEQQKRASTSGDEAQSSGAIALYRLQRDLQYAGYGISTVDGTSSNGVLGCDLELRAGVTITSLAPVTINPGLLAGTGADANTDTMLVVYGNPNGSTTGDFLRSGSGTLYTTRDTPSAVANDYVFTRSGSPGTSNCTGANKLALRSVQSVDTNARTVTLTSSMTEQSGTLYTLGKSPQLLAFAIRRGSLTVCDYIVNDCGDAGNANNSSIWVPLASDIASMRVQYGRDTTMPSMDGFVDTWDQTLPTSPCGWAVRAPAIKIVLVARGAVRGAVATTSAPAWSGSAATPIVLIADTNWQRYHYKVFETTVPLRNIVWLGAQSGC